MNVTRPQCYAAFVRQENQQVRTVNPLFTVLEDCEESLQNWPGPTSAAVKQTGH